MKKRLTILGAIIIVAALVGTVWFREATSPVNPQSTESRIFAVKPGESIRTVASRLKQEGFIRDPLAFFIMVKRRGVEKEIQAGDFRLRPSMSAQEIINELQHGIIDVWITTLEGWRNEEIALKLAQELSVPEQEFLKHAEVGYMFPDTYLFPREASASAVTRIMRNNFDKKVDQSIQNQIVSQGITFREGIILASIVEREGRTDEDRPVIAGILLKRLKEDWALNADATLQYALGYQADDKKWWKKALASEDKKIDSPYNSYTTTGLPPTPISNPGLSAITSVANPTETDYWFYLHDPDGGVHYATTLEEHNQNIDNYLR